MMNSKLKEVIDKVTQLPDKEQEYVAAVIEEQLAIDRAWDAKFEATLPQLRQMAREAAADYRAGKTEPLDLDRFDEPNES